MMKKELTVFIFLLLFQAAHAQPQQVKGKKMNFVSSVQVGFAEGQNGTAAQLQLINGFRRDGFFAGIGAGLDYYMQRSIPIFISLEKNFMNKDKTPFVFVNGGLNFPWTKGSSHWSDTDPGKFLELGLGYRFPVGENAITVNGGYSFKSFAYEETYQIFCLIPPCPEQTEHYDQKLRRVVVRVGFSF